MFLHSILNIWLSVKSMLRKNAATVLSKHIVLLSVWVGGWIKVISHTFSPSVCPVCSLVPFISSLVFPLWVTCSLRLHHALGFLLFSLLKWFAVLFIGLCEKSILKHSWTNPSGRLISYQWSFFFFPLIVSGRLGMKHIVLQPLNTVYSTCFIEVLPSRVIYCGAIPLEIKVHGMFKSLSQEKKKCLSAQTCVEGSNSKNFCASFLTNQFRTDPFGKASVLCKV